MFNRGVDCRDCGGYLSSNCNHVKWGSIIRSGNLDIEDSLDLEKLQGLNVKTFVDLRMVRDTSALTKIKNYIPNYKYIKVDTGMGDVHEPVIGENFSVKQARKAIYKTYNNMIRLNDEAIKDIFETLANEENYPVILGSKYGMYQTSVVSALLLAALDVPESVLYEDYLFTNAAFNTK